MWEPGIEEWRQLWADTNPVEGWDPKTIWIYKWNPYGVKKNLICDDRHNPNLNPNPNPNPNPIPDSCPFMSATRIRKTSRG